MLYLYSSCFPHPLQHLSSNYALYIDMLFLNHPTQSINPKFYSCFFTTFILLFTPCKSPSNALDNTPSSPTKEKGKKKKSFLVGWKCCLLSPYFLVWHELVRGQNTHFNALYCSRLISMMPSNIEKTISSNTIFLRVSYTCTKWSWAFTSTPSPTPFWYVRRNYYLNYNTFTISKSTNWA